MSTQHYAAFIKLDKQDVVEVSTRDYPRNFKIWNFFDRFFQCKKMPKSLAECFPASKVGSIAMRGWKGMLKAKRRSNKLNKMIVKPRKCLE